MPDQPNPAVLETSSAKPLFPEKRRGMFREALTVLNECGIPYAVSGAFALQRHTGIWRCTKDLDVFLIAENISAALNCLRAHGFECEIPDPVWLAKAHRDGFYIDLITGMSNAVITVEHTWIDRSQLAMIAGVKTRVLAPEELLASKVFVTRRERFDGADIGSRSSAREEAGMGTNSGTRWRTLGTFIVAPRAVCLCLSCLHTFRPRFTLAGSISKIQ